MIKIKDVNDLGVFKDIISLQVVDNKVEAIVVKAGKDELRIVKGDYYGNGLEILRQEPMQETKKFRVTGEYMGLQIVPKVFESEYDANSYIISMNGKLPYDEEHSLVVEEFVEYTEGTKI
jgi:hypothetical protein